MSLSRKPFAKPPRAPMVRSSLVPSVAVMRRVDVAKALMPVPHAAPREPAKTQAERDHLGRVAALGCVVCRLLGFGASPAQVHHCREEQGGGQRGGNFCTIPLCEPHHTGPAGVHGDKSAMRQLKMTEMDLLDITIGDLHGAK